MLMKKQLIIYVSLALLSLAACVTDFTPEVKGVSGILVVDGTITDGESVFRLSRSVSILDTTRVGDWIAHAVMCVEREDGATFPASYEGNGFYRIPTGDLDPASGYRLNFTIDGKNYQSSFLKPIETAPIDSVSWQKAGLGQPISIHVSSRAGADQSTYYRWTYFETWEVITPLTATAGYLDGVFMMFDPATPHNTRYCWGRDSSKTLLLENTAPLAENVVVRKKLFEIPCKDEKLSFLYHVEVLQTQLREEAYNYFRILRDEVERSGGIFGLVMSAGDNGNVYCISDPEEVIIGYVEVATTTRKSLFIPYSWDIHESLPADKAYRYCPLCSKKDYPDWPWFEYPHSVTYPQCVDCRAHYNATKNRPAWWPNDHY